MPFYKMKVTVETVTPLFLSGNDQKSVELRAASIRGQLRYWYRALLGGLAINESDKLHELESKVFGMEERGSPVFMRVKDLCWAGGRIKQNEELDLGYDKTKKDTRRPGLTYLLYSTQLGGNRRPYADVGTTFTLEFSSFEKEAKKWLALAGSALWCWGHFGGLGTRSRRGGGNIQVRDIEDNGEVLEELPDLTLKAVSSPESLKTHIENGLKKARSIVGRLNDIPPTGTTTKAEFPLLHPNHTDIWVVQETWNDAISAMNYVGNKFKDFRYKRPPDFPSVLNDYLNRGATPALERPSFGLPLQFRYRSAPDKQATVEAKHFTRRASPLLLRFLRLGNGKISLLLIHLKCDFLPEGNKLEIKGGKQKPRFLSPPTPSTRQKLIQEFRDQFSGFSEVRDWL
jgi:CRISPR-associated protein Cmr1